MTQDSDFLLTYGTLMRAFENPFASQLRGSSSFHGDGSFQGLLYRVSWYPGAVYRSDLNNKVYGEIYKLNNPAVLLPALDEYEDVLENESESLYLRKIIPVKLPDQSVLHCWVYLYNQSVDELELIEGGHFRMQ